MIYRYRLRPLEEWGADWDAMNRCYIFDEWNRVFRVFRLVDAVLVALPCDLSTSREWPEVAKLYKMPEWVAMRIYSRDVGGTVYPSEFLAPSKRRAIEVVNRDLNASDIDAAERGPSAVKKAPSPKPIRLYYCQGDEDGDI